MFYSGQLLWGDCVCKFILKQLGLKMALNESEI